MARRSTADDAGRAQLRGRDDDRSQRPPQKRRAVVKHGALAGAGDGGDAGRDEGDAEAAYALAQTYSLAGGDALRTWTLAAVKRTSQNVVSTHYSLPSSHSACARRLTDFPHVDSGERSCHGRLARATGNSVD